MLVNDTQHMSYCLIHDNVNMSNVMLIVTFLATTDSTASEEDSIPPPLPQKSREADYCNLPDDPPGDSPPKPLLSLNPIRVHNKVRIIL